ncbi:hypothetical protein FEM48_Zijuj11G0082600 [Ziziphus jujuba var. spinosa]|uniref:Beta-amyrin 11-oxidase-like n=1 Tax=Ziziphus jujuba var. spinosa TaxID=714518 RepID=A0A978UHU1_ZIZJJ|nr:hypothetical protein FEM48_Zijuj11G0082600 [Ziziphus jujuba var. spinosa]
MELDFLLLFAILLGGYVFVFGFLRNFNELFYVGLLKREVKSHLPPGDLGWPIVGNLLSFLKAFRSQDPDSFINHFISRYGKTGIYRTYLFGKPSIIVCAPDTSRKVLQNMEELKHGYPKATFILTGRKALHHVTKEEHRRMRRLTTAPLSGHEALSSYVEYIEEIGVKVLEEMSSMKEPVELLTETRKMAFKVITHVFMGEYSTSVVATVKTLYTDLIGGMNYSQPIDLPGFPFHKALKARKKLVKIFQSILDEKKATKSYQLPNAKKDLMGLLLGVEDEDGWTLEDEVIIDLLLSYLLAGHESSAHGILWTVIYLLQNPQVLQKAKEIMKRRPDTQKGLNLNEIRQMEYLTKVIDETLRRTTLSMANFREASVDVKLNGYIIPKGWKVLVMNRGVHMDAELHMKPKEFIPGRWDDEKPKAGSFLPFGAGARSCPGQDLAKLEITIFLHHFLLYYNIERVNPEAPINYLPIPAPSDNCLVRVTRVS